MNKQSHRFGIWTNGLIQFRRKILPGLLRLGQPLILLRRWLRPHQILLGQVESVETGGRPPLAMLFSGANPSKSFFLGLAFEGSRRETDLGTVRLREVFHPGFAAEKHCALIAVETNQSHFAWLKQDGWFFIPIWVAGGVRLPVTKEAINNNSVKNDLRKIRRQELEYSVTQDEARFADFYHHMHVPFVQKTYGDEAVFDTLAEKRAQCEKFDLLFVRKKDRPDYDLAGVLIVYEPAGPRFWSIGVRQDGVDHAREGVVAALYHFAFEYLAPKHPWMSLGSSRAFLHDGVLNFKRKLSQSLDGGNWTGFALKVAALTPGAKNFLLKNPFIFLADGALHAAVFVDEVLSLEKIQRLHKDYFYPGLTRLVLHTFRDEETFAPATLPPPLAGCVTIRRASELISSAAKIRPERS